MMDYRQYLLTCLAEECNEVAQRATKALRFGLDEVQEGQPLNNAERIMLEYVDLKLMIDELMKLDPPTFLAVSSSWLFHKRQEKMARFAKSVALSVEQGTLDGNTVLL